MERKVCTQCPIEENVEYFYKQSTECTVCNINRSLKLYFENKKMKSKRIYYEKNGEKQLRKQNKSYIYYKELRRSHADL